MVASLAGVKFASKTCKYSDFNCCNSDLFIPEASIPGLYGAETITEGSLPQIAELTKHLAIVNIY